MATWLKQSTAVDIAMGPFLDETDGKTAETALTITQPDIRLKKNGGNWAQKNAAQTLSHEEAGWYEVALNTTDTDTLGILIVAIHESGALPVWREFQVVPANVYDSLIAGTDTLQADVTQWLGTAAATPTVAGVPEVDVTHIAGSAVSTSSAQLGVNVVNAAGTAWATAINTALDTHDGPDLPSGSVAADGGNSATSFKTDLAETTDDYWKDALIVLTSGVLSGQVKKVTAYNGTTKVITVSGGFTGTPANSVTFLLINR